MSNDPEGDDPEERDDASDGVTVLVAAEALTGERLVLDGEPYRHLFRARRLRADESLRLVDGAGNARAATVESLDRQRAVLRIGVPLPSRDPQRRVELLVAMPRPERAAWLVEKTTELGVAAVRFLASERAVRTVDGKALARLRRVAAAALEQSGGARLPELSGPHAIADVAALAGATASVWCLDPGATSPLAAVGTDAAVVLIGPEGGWSAAELARFADIGARRARLGARTLRLETAAVAAAALLLSG